MSKTPEEMQAGRIAKAEAIHVAIGNAEDDRQCVVCRLRKFPGSLWGYGGKDGLGLRSICDGCAQVVANVDFPALAADLKAALARLAAIDAAVLPEAVAEIERRHLADRETTRTSTISQIHDDRATLLGIVRAQAVELEQQRDNHNDFLNHWGKGAMAGELFWMKRCANETARADQAEKQAAKTRKHRTDLATARDETLAELDQARAELTKRTEELTRAAVAAAPTLRSAPSTSPRWPSCARRCTPSDGGSLRTACRLCWSSKNPPIRPPRLHPLRRKLRPSSSVHPATLRLAAPRIEIQPRSHH